VLRIYRLLYLTIDATPTKVLLTGASGFVGQAVLASLLSAGHTVHAISRKPFPISHPLLTQFPADLADPPSLLPAAQGCSAAIHLVGIIREIPRRNITFRSVHVEGTRAILAACHHANIRRYVHMSALGTRPHARSAYHQSKWLAEDLVRGASLDHTIFRPSMITGPGGEFTRMLRGWSEGTAAPWLFFPYFRAGLLGRGRKTLVQPIALPDVARAFTDALTLPASIAQTYDLTGLTRLTWPEFYTALASNSALKPKPPLPIPLWYAHLLTTLVPPTLLPFNRSQLQMAAEDNTGNPTPFATAFGWTPRAFG